MCLATFILKNSLNEKMTKYYKKVVDIISIRVFNRINDHVI